MYCLYISYFVLQNVFFAAIPTLLRHDYPKPTAWRVCQVCRDTEVVSLMPVCSEIHRRDLAEVIVLGRF